MRTSAVGRAFIEHWETFEPNEYDDNGHPAIGFGHDIRPGERFDQPMTRETADEVLSNDLRIAESGVNSLVLVPLTQGQFDALVDVSFECGAGCLHGTHCLRKLNAGDYEGARAELLGFDHKMRNGVKVEDKNILARREAAASQLWDAPDDTV